MCFRFIYFSLFGHFEHASRILSYHIIETDDNIFNNMHTQYVLRFNQMNVFRKILYCNYIHNINNNCKARGIV